jgi:acyl-CoA dehydrogenase
MDFDDNPEEAAFRVEVRVWLDANAERLEPEERKATPVDLRGRPRGVEEAQQWQAKKADSGWACITWPEKFGGRGASAIQSVIWEQEESRYATPPNIFTIGQGMLGPTLMMHGTEEQKQRYLEPMLRGDEIWCQLFSEPGAGSDLGGLRTTAVRDGDDWVINGQKIWTSGAKTAHFMFCLVRTEPDAGKHAGISYLLIDMNQPGIDVRPLKQMTGGADFNEVFLTDVRTPKDWIVGKRGEGWLVSRTTLKHERDSIGNAAMTEVAFKGLVKLARESMRGGRPAIEDPAIRQRLAALEGYVLSHKYSGYRQLTANLRGDNVGILALMNKLHSTNIGQEVSKLAFDLLEADALIDPASTTRLMGLAPRNSAGWVGQFMSSLGVAIAGGTANIQRNVIAERGLGLPRDWAAQQSK